MITLTLLAQLTLSCQQVTTLYNQLGPEEFRRRAAIIGLTEAQMKAALVCIARQQQPIRPAT